MVVFLFSILFSCRKAGIENAEASGRAARRNVVAMLDERTRASGFLSAMHSGRTAEGEKERDIAAGHADNEGKVHLLNIIARRMYVHMEVRGRWVERKSEENSTTVHDLQRIQHHVRLACSRRRRSL